MFPVIGGHEGSGIVTEVGTNVTQVAVGDHVAVSFIPSCGTCHWCASGRQNLCDLGMFTLAGGMISDGTYRYHLAGENVNRMAQLGTFADEMVCHENSLVRIEPYANMKAAALDQLRHLDRLRLGGRPRQGQGRRDGGGHRAVVESVPAPFRERASPVRAPSSPSTRCPSSWRRRRRSAPRTVSRQFSTRSSCCPSSPTAVTPTWSILTPSVLKGELIAAACGLGSKDGRIVVTAIAPFSQMDVQLNLFSFAMSNQALLGTVFGSASPRVQVPNLLNLFEDGQLKIDEIITQEYSLDQVQQGYDDQAAGTIVRGVVAFDA